jgi:hypothetical protein
MSPPCGAVFEVPVGQGEFKSYIAPGLFGFEPLVPEDLVFLGLELPVQRAVAQQKARIGATHDYNQLEGADRSGARFQSRNIRQPNEQRVF